MVKRKECIKKSSYNCGASCINAEKICRVDGLKGQSVSILGGFKEAIAATKDNKGSSSTTSGDTTLEKHRGLLKGDLTDPKTYSKDALTSSLKEMGVRDPEFTYGALDAYSKFVSLDTRMADAGLQTDDMQILKTAAAINEFIDKSPKVKGEVYSGFQDDMVGVYGVDDLPVGDSFSFPSMTSFSTSNDVAKSFNGGGIFKVVDNKSGASIRAFSNFKNEDELLVPRKAKYKLVDKSFDPELESTVYTLEEV